MGIHAGSGVADKEHFVTAASALDCSAGAYSSSGYTVSVHKRQCCIKDFPLAAADRQANTVFGA